MALSIGSALSESLTYDEVFYLEEGRGILMGAVSRDPYNPPLMPILTGLPLIAGLDTLIRSPLPMYKAFPARMVTVTLGVILLVATSIVGARIFGTPVGLVAAFLLAFNPNILANSHYVTSDVGVTLFFFSPSVYLYDSSPARHGREVCSWGLQQGMQSEQKLRHSYLSFLFQLRYCGKKRGACRGGGSLNRGAWCYSALVRLFYFCGRYTFSGLM
ncbi:MAG: hypothetical protein AAB481_02520 [Patescibacteria group bacterium]